jgi:hypothetical protein
MKVLIGIFLIFFLFILYFGFLYPLTTFAPLFVWIIQSQKRFLKYLFLTLFGVLLNLIDFHLSFGIYPLILLFLGACFSFGISKLHQTVWSMAVVVLCFSLCMQLVLYFFNTHQEPTFLNLLLTLGLDFLLGFLLFTLFDILKQKYSNRHVT